MVNNIPKNFETKACTSCDQRRLIRGLRGSNQKRAKELADKLEGCLESKVPSCDSGACLKCGRNVRLDFLSEALSYINKAKQLHMATIILSQFDCSRGQLNTIGLIVAKQRFERILRDNLPSNLIVIGGIDVSLNSYENSDYYWNVHAHVLILKVTKGASIKDVQLKLRTAVASNNNIKRSLKIIPVKANEKESAITYCLKSLFEWRSGYWKDKNLRERAPHRATRGLQLPKDDEVELRLWLAQWTMAQRLILVGVKNPASPNHIRIRPTKRTTCLSELVLVKPKLRLIRKRVIRSSKKKKRKGRSRI